MTTPHDVPLSERTLKDLIGDLADGLPDDETSGCRAVYWPPDVFALTSNALRVTGAYRHATDLNAERAWPPTSKWIEGLQDEATAWWNWLLGREVPVARGETSAAEEEGAGQQEGLRGDEATAAADEGGSGEKKKQELKDIETLRECLTTLHDERDSAIDRLTYIGSSNPEEQTRCDVSQALLKLHSLADQACASFGVLTSRRELAVPHYLANRLISETGSLSLRPRTDGLVLPKMRTAQVGITLRSFSHHLAFQRSEAEVVWRAVPWANIDEDTLNVLVFPWPFEVESTDFKPRLYLGKARSVGRARFFEYESEQRIDPDHLLRYLEAARKKVGRVHLVILPELAVSEAELEALKDALAGHTEEVTDPTRATDIPKATDIPMILAGVAEAGCRGDHEKVEARSARNRVVLAVHFAERWYTLSQDKHHRWRMDSGQIGQYGLGGVLSGSQEWWEAIDIPNRKISFLVPNGWLALTPLICEDLARFDPISELLRSVGPTLVVAVLFDGPQLKERWSGRYASVLTDDPGCSVLTATALGMSKRSRMVGQSTSETAKTQGLANAALWKDPEKGWHEIDLQESSAAVLSFSTSWAEELTADGRSDNRNAARFVLTGVETLDCEKKKAENSEKDEPEEAGAATEEPEHTPRKVGSGQPELSEQQRPGGQDILEVSSLMYFADALVESDARNRELVIACESGDVEHESPGWLPLKQLLKSLARRSAHMRSEDGKLKLSKQFSLATRLLVERLPVVAQDQNEDERRQHFDSLRDCCKKRGDALTAMEQAPGDVKKLGGLGIVELPDEFRDELSEACRVSHGVDEIILWAIHMRISRYRRKGQLSSGWARLLEAVERQLGMRPPAWLRKHAREIQEAS